VLCASKAEEVVQRVKDLRTRAPEAGFVVFGLSSDLYLARAGLQAGARGFVHAGMEPSQIIRALSVASKGETAVPRELLNDLVSGREAVDLSELTHRQQEILELVAEGQTNAQISQQLFLSESTIKQHLRAAYKVLGVHNRTEAVRIIRKRADL
jgi:DNA-binding NarL/FixJ family response regulator